MEGRAAALPWGWVCTAKSRSTLLFFPLGFLCVSEPRYTELRSKESSKPAEREEMGRRSSPTSPGGSATHQVTWDLLIPHWLRVQMHPGASLCGRVMGSTLVTRRQELLLRSSPELCVSWASLVQSTARACALESSVVPQNPSLGEVLTASACEVLLDLLTHLVSSATDFHQLHLFRPNFPSDCPARQAVRTPNHSLAQPRHGGLGLPGDVCPHCKSLYFLAGLTYPTGCLYLPGLCRREGS